MLGLHGAVLGEKLSKFHKVQRKEVIDCQQEKKSIAADNGDTRALQEMVMLICDPLSCVGWIAFVCIGKLKKLRYKPLGSKSIPSA